ncbi:signal peptidase I [Natronorubrum thiooxidans]|uniref:Signal peptidase, endoplasmic reticulum-type n=1 Tax=Natronorubrum thiooxidans TaxID=308853 RepID=A0A1N7GYX2_9EURY|nr:signal peptidase I [Natronorubrum thiooxidans]SIS17789.1 signal peptidase, endoplasmic reticulum-type [Natronorubrum thiooxidans]
MNYKKLANGIGLLLLIALVVPFVIYAVPGVIGAQYSFVVLSGSMSPAIDPGDVVIVADRAPATIETNDVITFTRGTEETPVTHRVVGVEASETGVAFETRGDANSNVDASPVPGANVLGVVVLRFRTSATRFRP